jgi:choline dehydrogenase-like flavoprotein
MGGKIGLSPYPSFMVVILRSYPSGSGCLRLASGNPKDPPLIECRVLGEQADVDALVRGIKAVREITSTDPIASLIEAHVTPGPAFESDVALGQFVRDNTEVAFHPIGTCRMGVDVDAVVNPDMCVRGTENLWIADASIMPGHISANINAACMMIGIKLGKQLAARR